MEILALLPLIFGGVSTSVALAGFYRTHLRHIGTFEMLKHGWKEQIAGLRKISPKTKSTVTKDDAKKKEEGLIDLLAHGDFIVEPVKRKLQSRLFVALTTILLTSLAAFIDTTGEITPNIRNIEYVDIFLLIIQISVVIVANWTNVFVSKTEQEFLSHLSHTHALFYEQHVLPAMEEFNRKAASGVLAAEIKTQNTKTEEIRQIVRDEIMKLQQNNKVLVERKVLDKMIEVQPSVTGLGNGKADS